ncbi:hypothetical protein AB0957_34460 [Streptomyces zhihengii]|uniref:hypothetical protein n=1 Tax=Streptomyces zhihengii TaxID=1818004 RepID=UPI00345335D4
MRDIGTGGVVGFDNDLAAKTEVYYHQGGHGAALEAPNLRQITQCVLHGSPERPSGLRRAPARSFALLSRLAAPLFILLGLGVLTGVVCFGLHGPWSPEVNLSVAIGALLAVLVALDVA